MGEEIKRPVVPFQVSGQSSHYNPSASTSQASIDPGTGVATQATGQTSEDSNNLALTPKAGQASLGSQAALATRVIGQDSQDIGNQDLTSKLNVEQSQQVTPLPGPSRDLRTILNQQTLGQEYQGIESTQISSYTPISELWNEAYEDLRTKEKILVVQYEETLSGRLKTIQAGSLIGGLTALVPVTVLSSSKIKRKDQMQTILEAMMEEANQKTWKLRFGSEYEISARDVMQPLVGAINGANDYITGVLSPNPYASLAWAGVSLLLPLLLNPSKQAASLAKGVGYIANLLVQSSMREELYRNRYESSTSNGDLKGFEKSHIGYRDTLKELYLRILKFQATSVCYYSKHGALKVGRDMVKWDDWDSLLSDIETQERSFLAVNELWKDKTYEEECAELVRRHQESMERLELVGSGLSTLQKAVEDAQKDGQRSELLGWLSSVDPSARYNSDREKHEANTGYWLLNDSEKFKAWKHAPNSFLWLHGKAGSGKSILSSSVINHLRQSYDSDPQTALGFFYYSFSNMAKQDPAEMLCSLIRQLCSRRPDTPQSLKDLAQYKDRGHRPDLEALQSILLATIHGFSSVYIIIDALDECPFENRERKLLLEIICKIHKNESKNLHIFCTSRKEVDIDAGLKPVMCLQTGMAIDLSTYKAAIDHDIGLHIDNTLASSDFDSWPDHIKTEARETLIAKADGMFQYITCQFETIRKLPNQSIIRKALADLPKNLDATYDRMLLSTDRNFYKQVFNCLQWLAFSVRPLLLNEIAEVFVLDHEALVPFDESERLFNPNDVLKYLSGLVTTFEDTDPRHYMKYVDQDRKWKLIRLAHFSIKEYLVSERIHDSPSTRFSVAETNAHLHISESCLAYHLQISETTLANKAEMDRFLLWDYASWRWKDHLEKVIRGQWTASVTKRASRALAPASKSLLNMVRVEDPDRSFHSRWSKTDDQLAPTLYYTAFSNTLQLSELLIGNGTDVNAQGGDYVNALQAAAVSSNEKLVQLLLNNSANINIRGVFGNALQAAVASSNEKLVQLLLDNGASINAQGGEYGNALQAAAFYNNEKVVQLLLDNSTSINTQGGYYGNALQAAVAMGNEKLVQLLLDNGASINAQGGRYGNALQASLIRNKLKITRLLHSRGAKLLPMGWQWDAWLEKDLDLGGKERLKEFRADPEGYLARRKKEEEEHEEQLKLWEEEEQEEEEEEEE